MKMMQDGMTPRVLEQLADARRADARVHLDEVRAAREQKRHLGLAGNRPREQRLAGARRPDEQHALRNAAADRGEAAGLAEEVDDLLHFLLRLVDAGDVRERDRGGFLVGLARLAFERRNAARRDAIEREAEHAEEADAEREARRSCTRSARAPAARRCARPSSPGPDTKDGFAVT